MMMPGGAPAYVKPRVAATAIAKILVVVKSRLPCARTGSGGAEASRRQDPRDLRDLRDLYEDSVNRIGDR